MTAIDNCLKRNFTFESAKSNCLGVEVPEHDNDDDHDDHDDHVRDNDDHDDVSDFYGDEVDTG